jgi:nucleotide-binding universal stress UspA family protein
MPAMVTVSRILVATDFSEASARALEFGRLFADACGASLHLLHVEPPAVGHPDEARRASARACAKLEALRDAAGGAAGEATIACRTGPIAAEIVRYAADEGIDLIVMGTHSHGPAFQMVSGSIAEVVLADAPCAVLAVKKSAAAARVRAGVAPAVTAS